MNVPQKQRLSLWLVAPLAALFVPTILIMCSRVPHFCVPEHYSSRHWFACLCAYDVEEQ